MSKARHETIADIVAEMRLGVKDWKGERLGVFDCFADRIEAAAKREREAGAEAAQVCGEIGEMIGREATREKESRVGNAAKMRDALNETQSVIAKCMDILNSIPDGVEYDGLIDDVADELCDLRDSHVKPALMATPRNCDRPECATTKSAQDVWRREDGGKTAYYEWLLATYTEGGTTDGKKH